MLGLSLGMWYLALGVIREGGEGPRVSEPDRGNVGVGTLDHGLHMKAMLLGESFTRNWLTWDQQSLLGQESPRCQSDRNTENNKACLMKYQHPD